MAKYHLNPETGNPNLCRAKVKCRFGGESLHYSSMEEARAAFEDLSSKSYISGISKARLSKGARVLVALDRAQRTLLADYTASLEDPDGALSSDWQTKVEVRDKLLRKLKESLTWDNSDAPSYDPEEKVHLRENKFPEGVDRHGYSNNDAITTPVEEELYRELDTASGTWLKRLSTAEVKAVVQYNVSAREYAQVMAGTREPTEDEVQMVKYLHSALEKAPRTDRPFYCYSGVTAKRQEAIREQGEAGIIELDRLQSASLNPAQVNGFTHWEEEKSVVLEMKIDRVASLTAFNVHRGEMEVLVPPGSYKVEKTFHNLKYLWSKGSGRTAGTTFQATGV